MSRYSPSCSPHDGKQQDLPGLSHLIPEGVEFLIVGRPIEPLINPNRDRATLEVKVGREIIPVSLVRSCNTIAKARPEQDLLEEAVCTIQEGLTQPSLDDVATHFTQELEPDGQSKLDGEEPPQPTLPELKLLLLTPFFDTCQGR